MGVRLRNDGYPRNLRTRPGRGRHEDARHMRRHFSRGEKIISDRTRVIQHDGYHFRRVHGTSAAHADDAVHIFFAGCFAGFRHIGVHGIRLHIVILHRRQAAFLKNSHHPLRGAGSPDSRIVDEKRLRTAEILYHIRNFFDGTGPEDDRTFLFVASSYDLHMLLLFFPIFRSDC